MKTLKKYAIRLAVLVALIAGGSMTAKSQVSLDAYYNVDWQTDSIFLKGFHNGHVFRLLLFQILRLTEGLTECLRHLCCIE